jgi:ComF family protein
VGFLDRALDLVFPPLCPSCDVATTGDNPLCSACAISLYPIDHACATCAVPLEPPTRRCLRCIRHPPPFSAATAAYRYGGELAIALRRLKYEPLAAIARSLAPLFRTPLATASHARDAVVPIPLHWARRFRRGFNQTSLLCRYAASDGNPPLMASWLTKRRATEPQIRLDAASRRDNVAGAFEVPPSRRRFIEGRNILLVDDVVSTGATSEEAARVLLQAGANDVSLFCFARAET